MRAEDAAHRYSQVIDATRICQQTRYLRALLRCYTSPGREFVGAESYAKHPVFTRRSIYSLNRFLQETQPIFQ
jgi:hypothetical protein